MVNPKFQGVTVPNPQRIVKCKLCSRSLRAIKLETHKCPKVCSDGVIVKHQCDHCPKSYSLAGDLRKHVRAAHSETMNGIMVVDEDGHGYAGETSVEVAEVLENVPDVPLVESSHRLSSRTHRYDCANEIVGFKLIFFQSRGAALEASPFSLRGPAAVCA